MQDFTKTEAEEKKGKRICVRVDGAFCRGDIKKGMTGKVSCIEPSKWCRDDFNDCWTVSVQLDNQELLSIHDIRKDEYYRDLKEI